MPPATPHPSAPTPTILDRRSAFYATEDTFHMIDGDRCLLLDARTGEETGEIRVSGAPLQFGDVAASERAGLSVIHQESTAFADLNTMDNIFVGRERRCFRGNRIAGAASGQQMACPEGQTGAQSVLDELTPGAGLHRCFSCSGNREMKSASPSAATGDREL